MTTAYVTDERFSAHTMEGHVENAERLAAIQAVMAQQKLPQKMTLLMPVEATTEQIEAVHTPDYLRLLARTENLPGTYFGEDTYVLPQSFAMPAS